MPTAIAICLGASLGALARWRLALWLNHGQALIPWGTLAANWVGAYIIGIAVVYFQSQTQIDPVWRLAMTVGFLGALTTSTEKVEKVVSMLQQGRWILATGTTSLHVFGSLLLTWAGMRSAAAWFASA